MKNTEQDNSVEQAFVYFYKQMRKKNFADKKFVKNIIIEPSLEEFNKLFNDLTNIDWESDASVNQAYDNASLAIYNLNYVLLPQMIMCEYAENYEDAKILYDIAYQTYYTIAQYTSATFDANIQPNIIKEDIAYSTGEIKKGIFEIEKRIKK
jgi:hypothetical protein